MVSTKEKLVSSIFLISGLALSGCAPAEGPGADTGDDPSNRQEVDSVSEIAAQVPDDVAAKGTLDVATTVGMAPLNYPDPDSEEMLGFNVDIAEQIGDVLDLEVEMHGVSMDQIIPGMEAGKYDITASNMAITEDRSEVLDFVEYYFAATTLAAQTGNPEEVDLDNLCGTTVGVSKGSFQQVEVLPEYQKDCEETDDEPLEVETFRDQQSALLALSSGRVDAASADSAVIQYAIKQDESIEALGNMTDGSNLGIGVSEDSDLIDPLQDALQYLMDEGYYEETLEQWGMADLALDEAKKQIG